MKTFQTIAFAAALIFCLTSCVKEKDFGTVTPVTTSAIDTSFSTLKVAANFDWSTIQEISFQFTGSSQEDYQQVLKVLLPDGSVLFQKLQKANEDFKGMIEIPAHVTAVTVSFGSYTKTLEAKNGAIKMTIN